MECLLSKVSVGILTNRSESWLLDRALRAEPGLPELCGFVFPRVSPLYPLGSCGLSALRQVQFLAVLSSPTEVFIPVPLGRWWHHLNEAVVWLDSSGGPLTRVEEGQERQDRRLGAREQQCGESRGDWL